jgi:hypothetical protein
MKLTLKANHETGTWDLRIGGTHLCSLDSESMAKGLRDRYNAVPKLTDQLDVVLTKFSAIQSFNADVTQGYEVLREARKKLRRI